MIGRIQGRVLHRTVNQLLVDVGGLGYEVEIPLSTYSQVSTAEVVTLHTHLIVREDAHLLYGFHTESERELFRALIKVNRVGPRLAITIMSGMEGAALAACVRNEDVKTLSGLPGVGKKTAEQMIIDLRGRLPELMPELDAEGHMAAATGRAVTTELADAELALIGLGFKPQEAALALSKVEDTDANVETLIKQALKVLG